MKSARPEASPAGAQSNQQSKPEAIASKIELQGAIAAIEDGAVVGRIVFGGTRGIVFAMSPDGLMRQVADIIVGEVGQ